MSQLHSVAARAGPFRDMGAGGSQRDSDHNPTETGDRAGQFGDGPYIRNAIRH